MKKTAFLFPGQGAQYVGMGADFFHAHKEAKGVFQAANEILNQDITKLCLEGPEGGLIKTVNAQPAIVTTSIAILRVIEKELGRPDFVAGLSLGEYSALVCAESLHFSDAVRVVRARGHYMQEAVPLGKGKMAAIIGLNRVAVEQIVNYLKGDGVIEIANYNTSEQIVVSGEAQLVKNAVKEAKQAGARKAVLLPVSAPFHCGLQLQAANKLEKKLTEITIKPIKIPLINNVDAQIIDDAADIISSLVRQVSNSVLWQHSVEKMITLGVQNFIEIGPGETLSNFVKTIAQERGVSVNCLSIESIEGFNKAKECLSSV